MLIKKYILLPLFLLQACTVTYTQTHDTPDLNVSTDCSSTDTVDIPSLDQLFDPTSCQLPPEEPLNPGTQEPCFSAETILSLITTDPNDPDFTPVINVPAILKEDLYLHTTGPVTRRSLLDEPALQTYCFDNDYVSLSLQAFYNYTPKVFFTKNSPFIKDYIDLTNQNIINELSTAQFQAGQLGFEIDVDIPGVLGLFNNIKLQQHRAGLMVGICKQFPKFIIDFRIPFYYLLEHFFLTNSEIARIENNNFFSTEEPSALNNKARVEQFAHRHLVSDKFGFGDSRLVASFNFFESSCSELWAGLQVTLPTAFAISRGIIGGRFDPYACAPDINIKRLFNLAVCPETDAAKREAHAVIQQDLTNFLVGALDRLSTILINAPLGNGHHWGFGPQFDFRYQFNDYWGMHTYAAFEWFTKHNERRFFLIRKNPADFDRNFRIPEQAEENLSFLNTQIINTLFPTGVTLSITPGYLIKLRHAFMYDTRHWHALLGFDYWRQNKEKFGTICSSSVPLCALNFEKAARPSAQQGKIFGDFGYYGTAFCHSIAWHALLAFDATVFNSGIGKNYTLAIRLGVDF